METDPIITATAKILIEPDTTKFDAFMDKAEQDIAELGEKFKEALTVNIDDLAGKIKTLIDPLILAGSGRDTTEDDQPQTERVQPVPDQMLVKMTELQEDVSRIAKSLEELVEAMTTSE